MICRPVIYWLGFTNQLHWGVGNRQAPEMERLRHTICILPFKPTIKEPTITVTPAVSTINTHNKIIMAISI